MVIPAYCGSVVAPGAVSSSSAALGDADPGVLEADVRSRYLDEDISWVESGARILALAEDDRAPPLERVRLLAAAARGLDEMFQLRGVRPRASTAGGGRDRGVRLRVQEHLQRQGRVLGRLGPVLAGHGLCPAGWKALGSKERGQLERAFESWVRPALAPLVVEPGEPLPPPADLCLNVAVELVDDGGEARFGSVELPPVLPRFVFLADGRPVPTEEMVIAHLDSLFAPRRVRGRALFRVTRQTDREGGPADNLLSATESRDQRGRWGRPVRLEVEASASEPVVGRLVGDLDLAEGDVYPVEGMLGLAGLGQLSDLDRPELKAPLRRPVTPPRLAGGPPEAPDPFRVVETGDLLVHCPYDSWGLSVDAFVARAADAPGVVAVKHSLYRPAPEAPVVRALARAAERGIHVVVLVELGARLAERDSAACARLLERSGAHVVYGLVGLRTHCPVALVVVQRATGVARYSMVSTLTPRADGSLEGMSLLSADAALGADLSDLFNYLTGYSRPARFRRLLVAPMSLRSGLLASIRNQAEAGGRIRLKVNRLVDREVIDALYAASQAGARIDLAVAGACALRPGVAGLSPTIRVVAPSGAYRESSKILLFGAGADTAAYLSSADLAAPCLDHQVDVAVPVSDPAIRGRLERTLDVHLELPGWELGPDGVWRRARRASGEATAAEDRLTALAAAG